MIDWEKVIKGLEICRHRVISQENCKECPYIYDDRAKQSNCEGVLHWDALALMKEQPEIIRCNDCKWWHESETHNGYGDCGQANGIALKSSDWFCADGVRR